MRPDVERYRWLTLARESDFDVLSHLIGTSAGSNWVPLAAEWIDDELNAGKPKSDFPTLGTAPVFSHRAVDALLDLLIESGELLPLRIAEGAHYVYNTTRVLDALDEERSTVVRFPDGNVMRIENYEFREEMIRAFPVFRIPQSRAKVFVTDVFVERVTSTRLTGFDFRPIWPRPERERSAPGGAGDSPGRGDRPLQRTCDQVCRQRPPKRLVRVSGSAGRPLLMWRDPGRDQVWLQRPPKDASFHGTDPRRGPFKWGSGVG
jgi:hypothetical protein